MITAGLIVANSLPCPKLCQVPHCGVQCSLGKGGKIDLSNGWHPVVKHGECGQNPSAIGAFGGLFNNNQ